METVLEIKHLNTLFDSRDGIVKAVCDANLTITKGQIIGLVGETGCGKSVLGQSILRLLPENAKMSGEIVFEGENLLGLRDKEMRKIRGKKIAYISQNPSEALNPVFTAGTQLKEAIRICRGVKGKQCVKTAEDTLGRLSFENPGKIMSSYPNELSGGMKQRILVAMAMGGTPSFLIADEPTKGLDALIRGQVIETLRTYIEITGCSALIITHDLKFAASICDTLAVMYAGELVEQGPIKEIFHAPEHPYLKALIAAQPQNGLHVLEGNACSLIDLPQYCRFYERCPQRTERCGEFHPAMNDRGKNHLVRCENID